MLMVVAVIVWNSGIGFFIYGSIVGHRYGICKRGWVASILRGQAGLGTGQGGVGRPGGWAASHGRAARAGGHGAKGPAG